MNTQLHRVRIATSLLWAAAIIASAILKAPTFLTIILLPVLAFSSLTAIQRIGRQSTVSGLCS